MSPSNLRVHMLLLLMSGLLISLVAQGSDDLYPVPPPPLSEDTWPCMDCHADEEPDPTPRELGMHEEIQEIFNHAGEQRWCLDCHNMNDRDYLRLANGELVEFTESYRLCGQCHGTIFRDWRAGVHGRRTGYWNGRKEYRLCVHCHDPHRPHFEPIAPMPPPLRPEEIKAGGAAAVPSHDEPSH